MGVDVQSVIDRLEIAKNNYQRSGDALAYREVLGALWKEIYPANTAQSWLVKANLLDETDQLVEQFGDKIQSISMASVESIKTKPVAGHFVPLVDLADVGFFLNPCRTLTI